MGKKLRFSFLPIPEELMESKAITWGDKHLFGIIAKTNLEEVKFKNRTLAKRMKCSIATIKRRIKQLKENNLVVVRYNPGGANTYIVNLQLINIIQREVKSELGVAQHSELGVGSPSELPYKRTSLKNINKEGLKKLKLVKQVVKEKMKV